MSFPIEGQKEFVVDVNEEARLINDAATAKPTQAVHDQPASPDMAATSSTELTGYVYISISALAFAINASLVHVAETRYAIAASTSVFCRSVVQTSIVLACFALQPRLRTLACALNETKMRLVALRGIVGAVALFSLYAAFRVMAVGDAVAIFFTAPIFTFVFSHLVIDEPFSHVDVLAIVTSAAGIALLTRAHALLPTAATAAATALPAGGEMRVVGCMLALLSALLSGVVYTTLRYLGPSVHHSLGVFSFGACSCVLSGALMATGIDTGGDGKLASGDGTLDGLVLVSLAGVSGFVGQSCLHVGLQLCRAGPGLLIRNLEVPFAYAAGLVLMGERPTLLGLFAVCLIVASAMMIGLRQVMRRPAPAV